MEKEKFWDTEERVAEVEKNGSTNICCDVCTKDNKTYVNIREYYEDRNSGQMLPSKKGICIPVDCWGEVVEKVTEYLECGEGE